MLENLTPAVKITPLPWVKPAIEFDGMEGEATTPGYEVEPTNFNEFLIEAGFDPDEIEVIEPIRTSRWQVARKRDTPIWLTSYRFRFRRKGREEIDLPTLFAEARKGAMGKARHTPGARGCGRRR